MAVPTVCKKCLDNTFLHMHRAITISNDKVSGKIKQFEGDSEAAKAMMETFSKLAYIRAQLRLIEQAVKEQK
jgi:hypothetical protein